MREVVVWEGALDHPARTGLPCRVVVRDKDVAAEVDWGGGWRRGNSADYVTITTAALRAIADLRTAPVAAQSVTVRGPGSVGIDLSGSAEPR